MKHLFGKKTTTKKCMSESITEEKSETMESAKQFKGAACWILMHATGS